MHESILSFLRKNLSKGEVHGRSVIEVGSYDVNGSPRSVIQPLGPLRYLGVDIGPGPGVDEVCAAAEVPQRFGTFDIVISTEMLEHVRDWKLVVAALKQAVVSEGILIVTTRSTGFPYHGYPEDHWRFSLGDFRMIFADFEIAALESDHQAPGVLLKAKKPLAWEPLSLGGISVARV